MTTYLNKINDKMFGYKLFTTNINHFSDVSLLKLIVCFCTLHWPTRDKYNLKLSLVHIIVLLSGQDGCWSMLVEWMDEFRLISKTPLMLFHESHWDATICPNLFILYEFKTHRIRLAYCFGYIMFHVQYLKLSTDIYCVQYKYILYIMIT